MQDSGGGGEEIVILISFLVNNEHWMQYINSLIHSLIYSFVRKKESGAVSYLRYLARSADMRRRFVARIERNLKTCCLCCFCLCCKWQRISLRTTDVSRDVLSIIKTFLSRIENVHPTIAKKTLCN